MQDLRRVPVRTWGALLLAPAAWAAYILFAWALVPLACDSGRGVLHLVSAFVLAAAAGGVALALAHRAVDAFLPRLALALAPLFTLGVVLFWLSVVVLNPCSTP